MNMSIIVDCLGHVEVDPSPFWRFSLYIFIIGPEFNEFVLKFLLAVADECEMKEFGFILGFKLLLLFLVIGILCCEVEVVK